MVQLEEILGLPPSTRRVEQVVVGATHGVVQEVVVTTVTVTTLVLVEQTGAGVVVEVLQVEVIAPPTTGTVVQLEVMG